MLEYRFNTATGCYVYPPCPAIDIVFPIKKVDSKNKISYHPCLVSVKCWDSIGFSRMVKARDSMKAYLEEHRSNKDQSTTAFVYWLWLEHLVFHGNRPRAKGPFQPRTHISRLLCHPEISLRSTRLFKIWQVRPTFRSYSHPIPLRYRKARGRIERNCNRGVP